ncbi:MAG: DUF3604 domain-containing protein [Anaerolineae bacterium]|nr:DUF3604 domain-containing protein [Anaerolineae bacterium]
MALVTASRFFFNLITLLIGAIWVVFSRETRWKVHGAVIALISGLAPVVARHFSAVPPLGIISGVVFGGLATYALGLGALTFLQKRDPASPPLYQKIAALRNRVARHRRAAQWILIGCGIILPLGLWSSVHLDLTVALDNRPRMLWVHAPTTPTPGIPFEVTVQAWDNYERLSASYQGTVAFTLESYALDSLSLIDPQTVVAQLPTPYTFTGQRRHTGARMAYALQDGKDNGNRTFDVTISTPGIHYLIARELSNPKAGEGAEIPYENCRFYSNPIIVYPSNTNHLNIYWGDIHTHSAYSDGSGSPAHNAGYARHVARLDFYALTDHAEILFFAPWKYQTLESLINTLNEPGAFVAFHGVEWTNVRVGHYTLVFSGDSLPGPRDLIPGRFGPLSTPERLWQDLDAFTQATGSEALALPHHTTKITYPQDWSYLNPQYVRLAEVTSTHGDSLYAQQHPLNYAGGTGTPKTPIDGLAITDALMMGHHLALYAASDEHGGHPGHSLTHTEATVGQQRPWTSWPTRSNKPYPGGLTAVYARELSRESIFDALQHTRVYANSDHGRPLLEFDINGVTVGDGAYAHVPEATTPRILTIRIAQDGAPAASVRTSAATLITENWRPNWNAAVEILKNGQLLRTFPLNVPVAAFTYIDEMQITGTAYTSTIERDGYSYLNAESDNPIDPATLNTNGADFYIVRVVGANARMTYIGAIWVGTE